MSRYRDDLHSVLHWSRARPEEEFSAGHHGILSRPESSVGIKAQNGLSSPRDEPGMPRSRAPNNMVDSRIRVGVRPYSAVFSTTHKPNTLMDHKRPNPSAVEQQLQHIKETHLKPTPHGSLARFPGALTPHSSRPGTAPVRPVTPNAPYTPLPGATSPPHKPRATSPIGQAAATGAHPGGDTHTSHDPANAQHAQTALHATPATISPQVPTHQPSNSTATGSQQRFVESRTAPQHVSNSPPHSPPHSVTAQRPTTSHARLQSHHTTTPSSAGQGAPHSLPRGSKQALVRELQDISTATGQQFLALSPTTRPISAPHQAGWTPDKGLYSDLDQMSPEFKSLNYTQARLTLHWTKDHHTNKVSQLLRLGGDPQPTASAAAGPERRATEDNSVPFPCTSSAAAERQSPRGSAVAGEVAIAAGQQQLQRLVSQRSSMRHRQLRHQSTRDKTSHMMLQEAVQSVGNKIAFTRMQQDHVGDQIGRLTRGPGGKPALSITVPTGQETDDVASDPDQPGSGWLHSPISKAHRQRPATASPTAGVHPAGQEDDSQMVHAHPTRLQKMMEVLSGGVVAAPRPPSPPSLNPGHKNYVFRKSTDEHLLKALAAVAERDQQAQEEAVRKAEEARLQLEAQQRAAAAAAARGSDSDSGHTSETDDDDSSNDSREEVIERTPHGGIFIRPGKKSKKLKPATRALPSISFAAGDAHPDSQTNEPKGSRIGRTSSRLPSRRNLRSHLSMRSAERLGPNMSQALCLEISMAQGLGDAGMEEYAWGTERLHGDALAMGLLHDIKNVVDEPEGDPRFDKTLVQLKKYDQDDIDGTENGAGHSGHTYTGLIKPSKSALVNSLQLSAQDGWDPATTLNWSSRGITARKLPNLWEALVDNAATLTALQLSGNTLDNTCVKDLLILLSRPSAPRITQLDLSTNTLLTHQVMVPLSLALGAPSGDDAEKGMLAIDIRPLCLRRLVLSGVKLGDKGAAQLGHALAHSRTLRDLTVARCGIGESGGRALFEPLAANHSLMSLDASWNAMCGDTALALQVALASNCSLHQLVLNNNGFSDLDCARILSGLQQHGHWRYVDLSHNNVGAGTALVFTQLAEKLAEVACEWLRRGVYGVQWEEGVLAGYVDKSDWWDPGRWTSSGPSSPHGGSRATSPFPQILSGGGASQRLDPALVPPRPGKAATLGCQLVEGPLLIELGSNPLGWAGTRQILHALDRVSLLMESAAVSLAQPAPTTPGDADSSPIMCADTVEVPSWPMYVTLANCNITLADSLPHSLKESGGEELGFDLHSPNPFLKSLNAITEQPAEQAGKKDKKGSAKKKNSGVKKGKKGKGKESKVSSKVDYVLTQCSQALDTESPAGRYVLDLSHPGALVLVQELCRVQAAVRQAVERGELEAGVAVALKDIQLNGKPMAEDKLGDLPGSVDQGTLTFTVSAPSRLLTLEPTPLSDAVVGWMVDSVTAGETSDLFKLGFIEVACSHFYFSAAQCLVVFDPQMPTSERLRAAEQLYMRCLNPLSFWEEVLASMPQTQAATIKAHLEEIGALDMNCPTGRYNLNLGRSVDRAVALRLQEAACRERPWAAHKYFLSWRNATLGGAPLNKEGLLKLRDWSVPTLGTLKLDYVCYRRPASEDEACTEDELRVLLAALRHVHRQHRNSTLQIQMEYLPKGLTKSGIANALALATVQARLRAKAAGRPPAVSKELTRKLRDMACEMALPLGSAVTSSGSDGGRARHSVGTSREAGSPRARISASGNIRAPAFAIPESPDPNAAPEPPTMWWAETGFNAQPLLKRLAEREALLHPPKQLESQPGTPASRVSSPTPGSRPMSALPGRMTSPVAGRPGSPANRPGSPATAGKGATDKGKSAQAKTPGRKDSADKPAAVDPPPLRLAGVHMAPSEQVVAEDLAGRLLSIPVAGNAAALLSRCGAKYVARAMHVFLSQDPVRGVAVCAKLIEAMPPVGAVYLVCDMSDQPQPLLPADKRKAVFNALSFKVAKHLETVQKELNGLALKRYRHSQHVLSCFLARHAVTSEQMLRVVRFSQWEVDRVNAVVLMWGRCVDRAGLYEVWRKLTFNEQRQVLSRLGYWYVWQSLEGRAWSTHWYLDLTDPEQRDVAKELVRSATKETTRAKEVAKKAGGSAAVQHLENLLGNGLPLTIPEDDKMWSMIESSYQSLEFDFVPTPQQATQAEQESVRYIQASWRYTVQVRKQRQLLEAEEARLRQQEEEQRASREQALKRQASALVRARAEKEAAAKGSGKVSGGRS